MLLSFDTDTTQDHFFNLALKRLAWKCKNEILGHIDCASDILFLMKRGVRMTYVNPRIRSKFDSLTSELKKEIWSLNVSLNSVSDLAIALQGIIDDAETSEFASMS